MITDEKAAIALVAWRGLTRISRRPEQDAVGLRILADLREWSDCYLSLEKVTQEQKRMFDQITEILAHLKVKR